MVKLFELDPASDVWVLLDLQRDVHVGEGDDGTEETAVMIAASVARYFITANRSVGLIEFGDDLRVDQPNRGANHYTRILESLALARAVGEVSLAHLLLEESRNFGRHTTVVAVTPSPSDDWALALMSLAARGVKVAAVLVEAETFGGASSSLDVYGTLTAGGVYTYTVKHRDDLVHVLSAGADAPSPETGSARGLDGLVTATGWDAGLDELRRRRGPPRPARAAGGRTVEAVRARLVGRLAQLRPARGHPARVRALDRPRQLGRGDALPAHRRRARASSPGARSRACASTPCRSSSRASRSASPSRSAWSCRPWSSPTRWARAGSLRAGPRSGRAWATGWTR